MSAARSSTASSRATLALATSDSARAISRALKGLRAFSSASSESRNRTSASATASSREAAVSASMTARGCPATTSWPSSTNSWPSVPCVPKFSVSLFGYPTLPLMETSFTRLPRVTGMSCSCSPGGAPSEPVRTVYAR